MNLHVVPRRFTRSTSLLSRQTSETKINENTGAVALVMVGLPARGKTYIARKLSRYLRWVGVSSKVFNVGTYRRAKYGAQTQEFFRTDDANLQAMKDNIANECLEDMISWYDASPTKGKNQIGIFDAANTVEERRMEIINRLEAANIKTIFMEVISDKNEVIQSNILEVKIRSPDYISMSPEEAVADFLKRIEHYKPTYAPIQDPDLSYIKVYDVGERIVVNNFKGYLQSRILFYIMNLHITPRSIYFCKPGEALDDKSLRSEANLSSTGRTFAQKGAAVLHSCLERFGKKEIRIWTSTHLREMQTALHFYERCIKESSSSAGPRQLTALADINNGVCEGLSQEEIKTQFPEEYERRQKSPYTHRYPGRGESYLDLAIRLEPVILELERERSDVVIIANESVLRCLYAYFVDIPEEETPSIAIPGNTLIELIPRAYGCSENRYDIMV